MFHFYNTCLNSFNTSTYLPGGIIISSTFPEFSSITCLGFTILSAILFPKNSPVLYTTFLEAVLYPIIVFHTC